jgi:hypothetical protein
MNKLSPRQKAACDVADAQRRLCRELAPLRHELIPRENAHEGYLRAEAIERFKVSKNAFDFAWIWAIEETGNHHWYEPLPRSRKKISRTLLV